MADLEITDLHVRTEDREILRGVDLEINRGEIHALMGPNGSGKSTLANTLLGHPSYEITEGSITFKGEDITEEDPESVHRRDPFLAFQYPVGRPGRFGANFLRLADQRPPRRPIRSSEFRNKLTQNIDLLHVDRAFTCDTSTMLLRRREEACRDPSDGDARTRHIAILDETDPGLDIDALRTVAEGVQTPPRQRAWAALIITHYQRILHYVNPDFVHVLIDGRIVAEGGPELVARLEREGYD